MNSLQQYLIGRVLGCAEFEKGAEGLLIGNNLSASRLPGSAISLFIAALARRLPNPICVVTSQNDRALQVFEDLEFFGMSNLFLYPEDENLPYEFDEPTAEILARQIEALMCLKDRMDSRGETGSVFVIPIESILFKVASPNEFNKHIQYIHHNDTIKTEFMSARLRDGGYLRVPVVEARGEFAVRGGIIDVFPLNSDYPIRIDLFGDRVESLRHFDPGTQRSLKTGHSESVALPPAKKNLLVQRALREGQPLVPLWSLLPDSTLFLLDEPEKFPARSKEFWDLIGRQYLEGEKAGENPPAPETLFARLEDFQLAISTRKPLIRHHLLDLHAPPDETSEKVGFRAGVFDGLKPHFDTYLGIIKESVKKDHLVVIACDNDGQVQRFQELLDQHHLDVVAVASSDREARAFRPPPEPAGQIVLTVGPLHGGFVLPEAGLLFLTDREVFGRYKRRQLYRKLYHGTPVSSLTEIQRGDYVVHVNHGIGQFVGLRRQKLDGREADLIEIVYQDNDRLLVPVEKIQFVQKYSAVEGAVPALDKLGSKRWIQRKRKSQEAIEKMAEELLALYAQRATVKRAGYIADTVWQSEFEASFLYQETPDQVQAIDEVKADLQRPIPMDRLVCGDVGYGKTEVAMRAAFKVVQERRQVAVLAPTTILAQQHLFTFGERFADYDVRIAMLSRFKTPREQREILKRLRLGEVDIVIGTHRLLSRDVEFADLGLAIVDEEHRFGVRHKEKLKQMRTSVDVLTLTATPIPRTLHMALSGLRDMSVINTPPADRLPIRTHVIHFERDLIEEAVLRELNRGGQVFFVHNRVQTIDPVAKRLREVVPQASLAVAHGQMDEHALEAVMLDFVAGKYDILVSTTIIESGLDIPNVNTIVINRADALGLAQMYQLRGRVGRSARQAYAYLIVPHGQPITDAAVRRLAAIQEFVELGAGFQIAMRDMEIRGTGNILGREQHGAMTAVGFELYCDLLQKAVQKMKGEAVVEDATAEIKWAIDAYLPETYVPLESQRIGVYKRLAQVRTLRAVADIEEEMRDRYGRLPEPAQALVRLAALRVAAGVCRISRVIEQHKGMRMEPTGEAGVLLRRIERARNAPTSIQAVQLGSDDTIEIIFQAPQPQPLSKLGEATAILRQIAEAVE